ncbi:hypothetical protein IAT38_004218 [Cryptococcus sp. DSM 104549]
MPPTTRGASQSQQRVAYIWSPELQHVSDDLPSNVGRSSMVHGLIQSLKLLDFTEYLAEEEASAEASGSEEGGEEKEKERDEEEREADGAEGSVEKPAMEGQEEGGQERPANGGANGKARESGEVNGEDGNTSHPDDHEQEPGLWRARVVRPDETLGTKACLVRYHDKTYVEHLLATRSNDSPSDPTHPPSPQSPPSSPSSESSPRPRKIPRTDPYNLSHDNPIFASLPRYITLVVSATSTACRLLARDEADWAVCWDGGRHHAKRKEAGGFCYVNDLVLGCLLLGREGRVSLPQEEGVRRPKTRAPRVMYLDLDLHYSDGVSAAFHSPTTYPNALPDGTVPPRPPTVLTLSVHHSSPIFFPPPTPASLLPPSDTPSPFSLSLPLAAYPSNPTYHNIFTRCIQPIADAWRPDYVVLQLGTDGLPGDRVGQYGNWSVEGEGGMKWCVQQVRGWGAKVCVTGGGGYRHENAARAWAEVMGVLLDREFEEDTPIPHHEDFEAYAPSFTLQIPEAHIRDESTKEDLDKAAEVYSVLAERIKEVVDAHS